MSAELLRGCRGLVLGVSSQQSMGFHAARMLRSLGADVAVSLRPERRAFASELEDEGFAVVELDVREPGSLERGVNRVGERFERLDFLVHTLVHVPSGVLDRPLLELSCDELHEVMTVSVHSLIAAARYARPWLERSRSPRIVTLLSGGADFAMPAYHAIGIAKAALGASVRYLAAELGPLGILCNAVNFSLLETDAARRVLGAERTSRTRQHLAKRAMTERPVDYVDVARAIAFLSSPLCSNLTGEALLVDGGFSRSYF